MENTHGPTDDGTLIVPSTGVVRELFREAVDDPLCTIDSPSPHVTQTANTNSHNFDNFLGSPAIITDADSAVLEGMLEYFVEDEEPPAHGAASVDGNTVIAAAVALSTLNTTTHSDRYDNSLSASRRDVITDILEMDAAGGAAAERTAESVEDGGLEAQGRGETSSSTRRPNSEERQPARHPHTIKEGT